jgi:pSer/pThr/pTyr-binding forkhead associated (FHA) protein
MPKALQVRVLFRGKHLRSRRFRLESLVVGRDSGCDLVLFNVGVSRRHAAIERCDEGYLLRDLGSSNGTRVNGVPITCWTIEDGGTARIARFELVFRYVDDQPDPAPLIAAETRDFAEDRTMAFVEEA